MKSAWSFLLLAASAAVASPTAQVGGAQFVLGEYQNYPGFDFDLSARRLVQWQQAGETVSEWMTELEKIQMKANGVKFMDITDTQDLGSEAALRTLSNVAFPSSPNATKLVKPVLKTLTTKNMREDLTKFTSFRTRHYRSDTGRQSQEWLVSKLTEVTQEYAPTSLRELITITEFPHSWGQNSVIARIEGSSSDDDSIVVIGAHQDSTNLWPFLAAPGADDDGSGSMTILESYRGLLAANFTPTRAVEFHWYSAEEGGLLGSQAVAKSYEAEKKNVLAMSQFDMTAWVKRGTREQVGIIVDFVDSEVTEFNKKLVDKYLDIPYVETKCGYACSDHASWSKAGYRSSFTIESSFEDSNKNIHSTNDRIDVSDEFSFDHMLQFAKLAVAFAIELGGWKKSD